MTTHVNLEVVDGVATVTLEGADRLNAFSGVTARELSQAYRACDQDDAVRVVVLTGAGRAFCWGADLAEDARAFAPRGSDFSASPLDPPAWAVRKLVIAAVNGARHRHRADPGAPGRPPVPGCRGAVRDPQQVRRGMLGTRRATSRCAPWPAPAAADLLLTGRTDRRR